MSSSVGIIIPNICKNKIHVPNHQPVFYKQTQDTLHIRTKASCRRWCVDWAQPAYTLIASAPREDLLQNMGSAVSIRGREGRQVLVIFLVYIQQQS